MFFHRFKQLCDEKGISIYKAATEIGLNRAAANKWKAGSVPNGQSLNKLADYFGVSTDYLLGNVNDPFFYLDNERIKTEINSYENGNSPVLTNKDRRDVARDIETIMQQLDSTGDLMFDGNPMSDEARESIRSALCIGLELAKSKNKARFTPKKYRNDQD